MDLNLSKIRLRNVTITRNVLLLSNTYIPNFDSIIDFYFSIDNFTSTIHDTVYTLVVEYREKKSAANLKVDKKSWCSTQRAVFCLDYKYTEEFAILNTGCYKYFTLNNIKGFVE
ncbi:hypothetical protein [Microcystis phage Mel-JY01]